MRDSVSCEVYGMDVQCPVVHIVNATDLRDPSWQRNRDFVKPSVADIWLLSQTYGEHNSCKEMCNDIVSQNDLH